MQKFQDLTYLVRKQQAKLFLERSKHFYGLFAERERSEMIYYLED